MARIPMRERRDANNKRLSRIFSLGGARGEVPATEHLPIVYANIEYLCGACKFLLSGMKNAVYTVDDESFLYAIIDLAEPMMRFSALTMGGVSVMNTKIRRCAVLGPALLQIKYQKEKAEKFWYGVAHHANYKGHSPQSNLVEYILDTAPWTMKLTKPERARLALKMSTAMRKEEVYARTVIGDWNPYFEDPDQTAKTFPRARGNIRIAGTPYDGISEFVYAPKFTKEEIEEKLVYLAELAKQPDLAPRPRKSSRVKFGTTQEDISSDGE